MNFKIFVTIKGFRQFYAFAETYDHAVEMTEDILNNYGWLDENITTEIEGGNVL